MSQPLISVGSLIKDSWNSAWKHMKATFKITVWFWVLMAINQIGISLIAPGYNSLDGSASIDPSMIKVVLWQVAFTIVALIPMMWLGVRLLRAVLTLDRGEQPSATEGREAWKYIWSYLWIGILVGFVVMTGYTKLVFPAIWLALSLSFATYFLLEENLRGARALRASFYLVRYRWWSTLWRLIVLSLLFIVVYLAIIFSLGGIFAALHIPTIVMMLVLFALVYFFFVPITVFAMAKLFHSLKATWERPSVDFPNRDDKKACWLIILPPIVLIGVLLTWSIAMFIFRNMVSTVSAQTLDPQVNPIVEPVAPDRPTEDINNPSFNPYGTTGNEPINTQDLGIDPAIDAPEYNPFGNAEDGPVPVLYNTDGSLRLGASDARTTAARILNVALGFIGILALISMFIFSGIGVILLARFDDPAGTEYDPRSGKGDASEVPPEVKHWSWGAFGLTWVWGVYHKKWITLLTLIPVVGFFVAIWLGIKGREMIWKKQPWKSVADFDRSQHSWNAWGATFFGLSVPFWIISFFWIAAAITALIIPAAPYPYTY